MVGLKFSLHSSVQPGHIWSSIEPLRVVMNNNRWTMTHHLTVTADV